MHSKANRKTVSAIAAVSLTVYFTWSAPVYSDFHLDPFSDDTRIVVPLYTPGKGGTDLTPTKFYRIDVTCISHVTSATQISDKFFVKNSKFVSHTLWISNTPASQNSIPTSPVKLINVFSFLKDSTGQIVDATNPKCKETFLISGTTPTLTVAFAVNDSNTLSTIGQVLDNVATIITGIIPILLSGPLGSHIVSGGTAIAATGGPLQTLISALSATPQNSIRSYTLKFGPKDTIITADYNGTRFSEVSMKITPIDDISKQITTSDMLRTNFYQTLDGISSTYLSGITSANAGTQCGRFVNTLQNYYDFNRKDISFIVGYFAQTAFPTAPLSDRMTCIGNKNNAEDIVNYQFIYNQRASGANGSLFPLTQTDIDSIPWDATNHALLSQTIASPYFERLMALLAIYAQSKTDTDKTARGASLTKWTGNSTIQVQDLSTKLWPDPSASAVSTAIADKLVSSGFQKFGCISLRPTVGFGNFDAVFLAIPLAPATAKANDNPNPQYLLGELLAVRVMLLGTGNAVYPATVSQIQLTDDTAAVYEAANANHGVCNTVSIKLDTPKSQVAGTAATN